MNAGDVIVRLDATDLQRDADRFQQDLRQLRLELQAAHVERQEAEGAVQAASVGEGALTVDEAKVTLQLAEKKAARLRQEYDQLKPLLDKGVITREELSRTAAEVEESEESLRLTRRRTSVAVELTHPRETQRAAVKLAQRVAQIENLVGRVQEADARLQQLRALIDNCTIRARRPGLVIYEQYLGAVPRRKIRVADRVTASRNLVIIPGVDRMVVESTVLEADIHRLKPGQPAVAIRSLSRPSPDRPRRPRRDARQFVDRTPGGTAGPSRPGHLAGDHPIRAARARRAIDDGARAGCAACIPEHSENVD